jgi:hypothetical protein
LTLAKAAQDYEDMLNDYTKFCADGYVPYDGYKQFVWKHFDSPKYKVYLDEKAKEEAEEAARKEDETED